MSTTYPESSSARPDARPVSTPPEEERKLEAGEAPIDAVWEDPPGFLGSLRTVQNDPIGGRIIIAAFTFFLLGGVIALLMRTQLAVPENTFLGPEAYNGLFTMHGSTMMYLFAVPILEGFAILLLPHMLGNREMPFPRLGAYSVFTLIFGAIMFYMSFLFNEVPQAGWFAYVPLSGPEYSGRSMDFWLLALGVTEIAGIAAGVEIVAGILHVRGIGMSISRMPLFAWAMLVMAFSILFAFTPLIVVSLMLETDRSLGTQFFNPAAGGSPVLWQHLFWIFGHPDVYIQFIPATGMISMIVPAMARRPIVGYPFIAMAIVATGFLSFGLWVHHMFTVGLPQVAMTFFTAASTMIAIPSGVQIFAWLTTIWRGRPQWRSPFLFVIGFILVFVLGGITGIMVASVPVDTQVHDSFFVVAHFHYVLIGGVVFPIFAAFYYWFPMIVGKLLDERLGRWHFWLLFIGFNLSFFPMHILGLLGMPRRVYTYQAGLGWDIYNLIATIGGFMIAAGVLVFLVNVARTLLVGERSERNPWNADSLEWAREYPRPNYGFRFLPIVRSRHPLWEQEDLEPKGNERLEKLVRDLGNWPTTWRAALTTSTWDGEPREVFRVAGPSIWPLFAAIGTAIILASEIWRAHAGFAVGALIVVVSLIGWHWPTPAPTSEEDEEAFAREHGVEVRSSGSRIIARAATWLSLLVLGVILASFAFSYFFIRLQNEQWPLGGIPLPDVLIPSLATGALVLSGGAVYWARRGIQAGDVRRLMIGLAAASVLGALVVGLFIYNLASLGYDHTVNAYASLFWTISLFLILALLGGLIMMLLVEFWAWRGSYSARRHVAVEILSIFWGGAIVGGVLTYAMLYLSPYVA